MRKWISILFVVAILLGLAGCSSKGKIVVENGEYYLVLNTKGSKSSDDNSSSGIEVVPAVYFSTLSELKNDFETLNFTEEEFEVINKMIDNYGRVRIPNLSKLNEPVVPDGYSFTNVTWYGSYFIDLKYKITSELTDLSDGFFKFFPESEYENQLKKWEVWEHLNTAELLSQEREEERNATVYHIQHDKFNKIIVYSIVDGDKTIYVREKYLSSGESNVPCKVSLWVNDDGICYSTDISLLTERPSVEWLSSFGVKEYVETATQ